MESSNDPTTSTIGKIWVSVFAVLALILVVFGLWALGAAIYAAWSLFRDPDSITYFAEYFLETTKITAVLPGGEGLAHYVSWVTVVLLLLVLGKLGAWAIGAGAQLLHAGTRHTR